MDIKIIVTDNKTGKEILVQKLEVNHNGTVTFLQGIDLSDYDKDGYTWSIGSIMYKGKDRYTIKSIEA